MPTLDKTLTLLEELILSLTVSDVSDEIQEEIETLNDVANTLAVKFKNGVRNKAQENTYEKEQAALKAVFDLVCNKKNWKYPVRAWVPSEKASPEELRRAIIHFTGGPPTIEEVVHKGVHGYLVTAPGYYECIGA